MFGFLLDDEQTCLSNGAIMIRTLRTKLVAILASLTLLTGIGLTTLATDAYAAPSPNGQWEQIGDYWYFKSGGQYLKNQWIYDSGYWYYVDGSGIMLTGNGGTTEELDWSEVGTSGWHEIGGKYYNFYPSGRMVTGWQQYAVHYTDGFDYGWYYFGSNGALARNEWRYLGGNWYYFQNNGVMRYNWYPMTLDGTDYLLGSSGALIYGWYYVNIDEPFWVYADSNGVAANGWRYLGGKWYYFDAGYMYNRYWEGDVVYVDGAAYHFRDDGSMATGWINSYGDWLYAYSNGQLLEDGWVKSGNNWYYFEDFYMYTSTVFYSGGLLYGVGSDGAMITNDWAYSDDWGFTEWWYFGSNGAAVSEWYYINGYWYYFDPYDHNVMVANTTMIIGDVAYTFDSSGRWVG